MFYGEHRHSLDVKGRLIFPARHREQLAGGGFMTTEIDGCLSVWLPEDYQTRAEQMRPLLSSDSQVERRRARVFFGGTEEFKPDGQGRVMVPAPLREYAGFEKEVAIVGAFDHLEIWDAPRWEQEKQQGHQQLAAGVGT